MSLSPLEQAALRALADAPKHGLSVQSLIYKLAATGAKEGEIARTINGIARDGFCDRWQSGIVERLRLNQSGLAELERDGGGDAD